MYLKPISRLCVMCILTVIFELAFSTPGMAQAYQQTNFVSDIQGLAPTQDGHLLNPWGLIASSTSPWWVSDNNGGVSTLYNGNTGAIVLAVDLGNPRTISTVRATWLNATFCPGHGTCSGFNPINYTILTAATGAQTSWKTCRTVSGNSSFTTTDSCPASNVQYVEYDITSWNSMTPFSPIDAYGPAANSLTVS